MRILLIEIRNSGDDSGGEFDQWPSRTRLPNTPADLPSAPPDSSHRLWVYGRPATESVTGRNRLALAQLEHALADRLEVHRVVVADSHAIPDVHTDPLSWSLTPRPEAARCNTSASSDPEVGKRYKEALTWFIKKRAEWDDTMLIQSGTNDRGGLLQIYFDSKTWEFNSLRALRVIPLPHILERFRQRLHPHCAIHVSRILCKHKLVVIPLRCQHLRHALVGLDPVVHVVAHHVGIVEIVDRQPPSRSGSASAGSPESGARGTPRLHADVLGSYGHCWFTYVPE